MERRDFLQAVGLGIGSMAVAGCMEQFIKRNSKSSRPNILFLMSDDHSYNAVSCYNGVLSKASPTPNIDRIANEGIRFDNCFVTNSLCAPSRATILTGKYSHLNKLPINYIEFDGSQQTVPKLLQKTGYNTAIVGKWHLMGKPTGFDYWNILVGQGRYIDPEFMEMELVPKARKGYVTNVTADIVMDWIGNKWDSSKPFFLMCHNKAPHEPWQMDPADEKMFEGIVIPEPETLYDDHKNRAKLIEKRTGIYPELAKRMSKWKPKERAMDLAGITDKKDGIAKTYQHYLKNYLGCIHSIDKNVGRIYEFLKAKGILDNTLIIYTSDNGMFLGEHTWHDKRMMYEESLKVPLVARYPCEIKAGTVSNEISLNLDFPETFLDYAGTSVPSDMQGESLRPVFKGRKPANWRQSMFYAYYETNSQYGVRTKDYKLICYSVGQFDMFDLKKDPLEMYSVYDDPAYADIRKKLEAELVKLRKKYNVQDKDLPGTWDKLNQNIIEQVNKSGF
jgi:arylsulfatase A-like enzyme